MNKKNIFAFLSALFSIFSLTVLAAEKKADDISWGLMVQLGHNMWGEEPLTGEPKTEEEMDKYARDFNRTDEALWREVTSYAAKKGVNLLLIDLGEAMVYPSHPELAVKGSWSPEKMKLEIARLRSLGLEPIPKLNFSASHDAWLKQYSRMLSTPEYYKVCSDLIRDVCEIFGKPRLFHLGWDEEKIAAQGNCRLAVVRQGDLLWHDLLFTVNEVEKNASQAWVWSDVIWKHKDEFLRKMPHRVMQSNWHYFFMQNMVRNDAEIKKREWPEAWAGPLGFLELEEAKYDQIPCASNYKVPKNLEVIVKFAKEHIARERIKGFLMAPWTRTYGEEGRAKLLEACDLIEKAKKIWADETKDIVIYGATPAGISAAIQARKKGLEPILIEPSSRVGDTGQTQKEADLKLREYAIVVYCNERVDRDQGGVEKVDGRIVAIRTESGKRFAAKQFLDCTHDGELNKISGVTNIHDVSDYGAKGDGRTKDTIAIQKAINAASANGGGIVRLGAGTFLSGSVFLKSNVELFLDHGATLKGSPDKEDYNKADICQQNVASKSESASGAHLLLCIEQTNVVVRGYGRIEGNSPSFLIGPDGKNWKGGQSKIPWRPSQMVYFVECENVRMQGVSLIDSPYWSCFFHGCKGVEIKDLLIRTRREPIHTHNGDGIDIDSCQDVEISNCDIDTADDCITLRANTSRLKVKRPCERIRISNCRLSSPCNAVRIGVGDGVVREATLKNLEIYDTRTAVNIVSGWSKNGKGVSFKDITFDTMKVECRNFCRIYPRYAKSAKFEGIRFANVVGTTTLPAWIWGYQQNPIGDVTFEDVNLANGIMAVNVSNLTIIGGTVKRNSLTKDEVGKYVHEIENGINFPGNVKIGGTVRGSMAHGGEVKMPKRGLCAHQGDFQFYPGNTAESLHSAVRKGAAMVEFDVQRCSTGEFVLMHDSTIDNLTTGTGLIREHSLAELKSFRIRRMLDKGYRIPTLDEVLDVIPDGGILINVHCYAGHEAMGEIARHLKARGRLHQAFVCSWLDDIDRARKDVPEVSANNISRPGPRNRDWTDAECMKFITDSQKHRCQYLQLSRPWAKKYSVAAHELGVKVIHFRSDNPVTVEDLFVNRGIDFVLTNQLEPMVKEFRRLGLSIY